MNLSVSSLDSASAERADDKAMLNIPVNPAFISPNLPYVVTVKTFSGTLRVTPKAIVHRKMLARTAEPMTSRIDGLHGHRQTGIDDKDVCAVFAQGGDRPKLKCDVHRQMFQYVHEN
jgi:hypothetical protein